MDETHFTMGNKGPFSQFVSSCNYVKVIAESIVHSCPNALIAVFVHPVTAMLPLITEIFKQSGNWDPNKVIGSAALESMRIAALTAAVLDLNPSFLSIPITGGVDPLTIVPLLSRTIPFNDISTVSKTFNRVKSKGVGDRDYLDFFIIFSSVNCFYRIYINYKCDKYYRWEYLSDI